MGRPLMLMSGGAVLLVLVTWAVGELVTSAFSALLVDELDRPAMRWVAENRNGVLDAAMKAVTHLGDRIAIVALLGAASVAAAVHRSRRWTAFFLAATTGGLLLSGLVKQLVDRPRPDLDRLVEIGGLSFPSGHATAAAVCYGSFAVAALAVRTPPRVVLAALCAAIAIAVAASRVWIGVHYPTDVVAGLACGSAWVTLAHLAFLREGWLKPGVYPPDTGRRGRVA